MRAEQGDVQPAPLLALHCRVQGHERRSSGRCSTVERVDGAVHAGLGLKRWYVSNAILLGRSGEASSALYVQQTCGVCSER